MANRPDVELSVGIPKGAAYKSIKKDLNDIQQYIDKHAKLKLSVALKQTNKGALRKEIQAKLNEIDGLKVVIPKITLGSDAKKKLKNEIASLIKEVSGNTQTVTFNTKANEKADTASGAKQTAREAEEAKAKLAAFNEEMRTLVALRNQLRASKNVLEIGGVSDDQTHKLQKYIRDYEEWMRAVDAVNSSQSFGEGQREELIKTGVALRNNMQRMLDYASATEVSNQSLQRSETLLKQARSNLEKWTAAKNGRSSGAYDAYKTAADDLERLNERAVDGSVRAGEFRAEYQRIQGVMKQSADAIHANGEATKSFSDRLEGLAKKFASWFTVSQIIMRLYRTLKQMVSAVIEIDTAMTELKKVTDETAATYDRFLIDAGNRAKQLGATVADIVTATADFARLGYNIADATALADVAIVYKNVGDGIANISDASESIISTLKAFGISARNAMSIVDKFNEVGNNFAISSKGVGDALLRSASAMRAAGNDIDETIALATAANTIVQSPEKVGTVLKTVSMFLRSAKTELEEAGEDTEGMAESVSKLRGNILALTGNRVDIQKDADTYKSTTQILRELAAVWDDLTDVTRANILEMIGGKRNANVTAALLENFQLVEDVLEVSKNSSGSALRENEKYLQSIQGHIDQFKAAFQELSTTVVDGESVKFFVDLGKGVVNVLNSVLKLVSAIGGIKGLLIPIGGLILTFGRGKIWSWISSIPTKILPGISGLGDVFQQAYNPAAALNGQFAGMKAGLSAVASSINPVSAAFGVLTAAITIGTIAYQRHKQAQQAIIEARDDAARKANEERETIAKLTEEYKRLAESGIDTDDKREQARDIQSQITDLVGKQAENLDLVNGKLDEQIGKLDKIAYKSAKDNSVAIDAKYNDALGQFNAGTFARNANETGAGLVAVNNTARKMGIGRGYSFGITQTTAGKNAQEIVNIYTELLDRIQNFEGFQDELTDGSKNEVKQAADYLVQQIEIYQGIVDEFNNAKSAKFQNDALAETYQYLEEHNVKTQEQFDDWIKTINTTERASDEYRQILVDMANKAFPQFAHAAEEAGAAIESIGTGSVYDNVKTGFEGVAAKIAEIRTEMEPLTKLQEAIAEGFTMSIDKALEFAKVYPEILNNAELSADGQITLNEDVVRSFIDGKNEEISANIEAEVAKLQADRDAYAGKMQLAQAELDYLTQIKNGEIEVTRGEAEYRINLAKAVAQALIDGGMQESEAYAAAAEYISNDFKGMATVGMEAGKNIDHNLTEAAKAAATAIAANMGSSMEAVAALGDQSYETAKTIDGMKTGKAIRTARVPKPGAGSKVTKGGNYIAQYTDTGTGNAWRGTSSSSSSFALTWSDIGGFDGSKYTFTDKGTYGLDAYMAKLDAEIGDYRQAIANLDGQIAALRAGKKIETPDSSSKSGSKSGGGSSGGSSSSSKDEELERLKSIVSLLETELKLLEAQDAPAKDRIDKIHEIQDALQDEIDYLKSIGGDQETINNLTIQWLQYQKDVDDIYADTTKKAKDALDELAKYRVKMMQDELKKQRDNLDKQLDALKDFYDRQKKLLRDQYDEEKYLEEQSEKRQAVADIQAQIDQLRFDDSAWAQRRRLELEEELAAAQKELDDFERDHALEVTEDQLDRMYEMQAEELEREKEAIDQTLDDEYALYLQALDDIKNGTIDLYNELAAYAQQNGDPVADTIKSAWEAAYRALQDYRDLYGEDYEGASLEDATGSGGASSGGGSSGGGSSNIPAPSAGGNGGSSGNSGGNGDRVTLTSDIKRKVAAAIWNGNYGWGTGSDRAHRLSEVFGADNGIQALVNQGIGRSDAAPPQDFTYLNMRKKFRGYWAGTRSATPGIHAIDERGNETIFETKDGVRYKMFSGGEKVLDAKSSSFLYDFAKGGGKVIEHLVREVIDPRKRAIIDPPIRSYQINAGDIIVQGNADRSTISEIRRARKESVEMLLKEFNRLNK